mmetsp:Transcript_48614/g.105851  ORF Transcript_48614/g.105851 Transcript_48614/m.105851 type:complete len:204 (+) Transcript_48614:2651-3262(+)
MTLLIASLVEASVPTPPAHEDHEAMDRHLNPTIAVQGLPKAVQLFVCHLLGGDPEAWKFPAHTRHQFIKGQVSTAIRINLVENLEPVSPGAMPLVRRLIQDTNDSFQLLLTEIRPLAELDFVHETPELLNGRLPAIFVQTTPKDTQLIARHRGFQPLSDSKVQFFERNHAASVPVGLCEELRPAGTAIASTHQGLIQPLCHRM